MKISELLAQPTVELNAGDYLASITRSESFVPSFRDTRAFVNGRHLFKIVGVGAPDGVTGKFAAHNVVPVEVSEDGKSYVEAEPIIIQEAGKVTYVAGRNDQVFKDGYQDRHYVEIKDIAAGEEHRQILLAFADFAQTEFSLGVNDFQVEGPEHIQGA
jgi:hypothetical protein